MNRLADIICDHGSEFLHAHSVSNSVFHAIRNILSCGTALAGRIRCMCPHCGHLEFRFRSCGNRNCPHCGQHRIVPWVNARMAEHLNVPYFLITFTLPHEYAVVFHRQSKDAVGIFFAGSETGGQNLAIILSFVETCRANKISFRVWLEDVLRRFSSTPAKEIDSLLPQNWKPVASPLD